MQATRKIGISGGDKRARESGGEKCSELAKHAPELLPTLRPICSGRLQLFKSPGLAIIRPITNTIPAMSPSDYETESTVSRLNLGWESDRLHVFMLTHSRRPTLALCSVRTSEFRSRAAGYVNSAIKFVPRERERES